MAETEFLRWIIVGVAAGGVPGLLTREGLLSDVIFGVAGAAIGGYLCDQSHPDLGGALLTPWLSASAGAIMSVLAFRLVRRPA
jgi:uncharacterized membrane protein YeaQ/YmgE (transglycosylase-associated protein family)